jgi:D-alanyl-D-alanine dipeptidase
MYTANSCIVTAAAGRALAKVQDYLLSGAAGSQRKKYSLKVYDCYRPAGAVADFVAWSKVTDDTLTKAEFYPEHDKADLFDLGYIALRSGHSRGSTIDLTIVELPAQPQPNYVPGITPLVSCHAPRDQRWADNTIDMGTGFDCQWTQRPIPFSPSAGHLPAGLFCCVRLINSVVFLLRSTCLFVCRLQHHCLDERHHCACGCAAQSHAALASHDGDWAVSQLRTTQTHAHVAALAWPMWIVCEVSDCVLLNVAG